jgi:hypothetical protein
MVIHVCMCLICIPSCIIPKCETLEFQAGWHPWLYGANRHQFFTLTTLLLLSLLTIIPYCDGQGFEPHFPVHQSINQFICFPKIQLHVYQPHGYRNGQRVLYRLLLITVSVNKLGILLFKYNRLKYRTLKYSAALIHVALIKHIQKAYSYSKVNTVIRFDKSFCNELYIKTY